MGEMEIRLAFLAVGVLIGWALGMLYSMNRYTKRIKDNTDATREMVERWVGGGGTAPSMDLSNPLHRSGDRDERGAVNLITIGMVIALVVVVASLFSTLNTNRQVAQTQDQLAQNAVIRDKENNCTATILFSTVDALNQRTEFSGRQASANIRLQRAQLKFLQSLAASTEGDSRAGMEALDEYLTALNDYVELTAKQRGSQQANPYPTQAEYAACLDKARGDG